MKRTFLFWIGVGLITCLSGNIFAQWADNKYAREDAMYVRYLEGSESVTVDGVEDAIWASADSIVVGYGETNYLPGSGYDLWTGQSMPGDSANAVFKCLYKAPYIYLLYKVVDKSVGGWDWGQFDAIIMAFKDNTGDNSWVQAWDKRVEHFYTWGYHWAFADSFPNANLLHGYPPLYMGNDAVAGGLEAWRNPAQQERWMAATMVNGTAMDTLPDVGWITEHRIRIDSLGFDIDGMGDVLPFSFSMFDADGFLDSTSSTDAHTRTWWGCPWNENWYYAALFLDPSVTTSSPGGMIPPPDYNIPHLPSGSPIAIDGDLAEWPTDYTLQFRAKWQDEAGFSMIRGTGDWGSGYQQFGLPGQTEPLPTVVDGPEVDYWVSYDDANLYVGAKVTDQIVTKPYYSGQKDGITFHMLPRDYSSGNGIFGSAKNLTVSVDSSGDAVAGDDLIALADTGGVEYALMLGDQTDINDWNNIDNGFFVELKIPFATFTYPASLGDSVVFIAGMVKDIDIFDDTSSNTYSTAFWFGRPQNQHAPAWVTLGPAIPVGVDDQFLIPSSIELYNNYPNPFNPITTIKYTTNVTADVTLYVYDILGQVVSEMNRTNITPGYNEFKFNADGLASGVYLYCLKVKDLSNSQVIYTKVHKMMLLK